MADTATISSSTPSSSLTATSSSSSSSSSSNARKRIIVIGATGRQGGATIDALLEINNKKKDNLYEIAAITRDLTSAPAKQLAQRGIELIKADCLDKASLDKAFKGAYGVFGVTNPFTQRWNGSGTAHTDTDAEVVQGKNMVLACRDNKVAHFVFASVASAGEDESVLTFAAKWKVEQFIKEIGIPATIIAPVGFFENMESSFAGIKQGVMPGLLKPNRKAQMISTVDIGIFVSIAFENPGDWIGKRFEVAGDDMTMEEQCATIARVRGEEGGWKVSTPPDWVFKLFIPKAVGTLKRFLDEKGCHVDLKECRKVHPGLMSFEMWLKFRGIDKRVLPAPSMCSVQ